MSRIEELRNEFLGDDLPSGKYLKPGGWYLFEVVKATREPMYGVEPPIIGTNVQLKIVEGPNKGMEFLWLGRPPQDHHRMRDKEGKLSRRWGAIAGQRRDFMFAALAPEIEGNSKAQLEAKANKVSAILNDVQEEIIVLGKRVCGKIVVDCGVYSSQDGVRAKYVNGDIVWFKNDTPIEKDELDETLIKEYAKGPFNKIKTIIAATDKNINKYVRSNVVADGNTSENTGDSF